MDLTMMVQRQQTETTSKTQFLEELDGPETTCNTQFLEELKNRTVVFSLEYALIKSDVLISQTYKDYQ